MRVKPIQFVMPFRNGVIFPTSMIRSFFGICEASMEGIENRFDREWERMERKTYKNSHPMLQGTVRERRHYCERMIREEQERKWLDESKRLMKKELDKDRADLM